MVDIHCHILPEVDDGAKSWEIALEMCRMAAADGVQHIVATPHANHEYEYDRSQHEQKLDRLRYITGGLVTLTLGCDFHFSYENIQDALVHPERYCIGNTRYLLVEFSDFAISPTTGEFLQQLMAAGLTPIITHPERNPILQRTPQRVVDWASQGVLVQVTANSLTGRWGPPAKKSVQFLAKHSAIHVVASDAHDTKNRPPLLAAARDEMAKLAGKEAAEAMVQENPQAIVSGKPIPFQQALSKS
jgi:protein-tyrosine phosphatase